MGIRDFLDKFKGDGKNKLRKKIMLASLAFWISNENTSKLFYIKNFELQNTYIYTNSNIY